MLFGTQELVGRVLQTHNGFGDIKLAALFRRFLDGLLRLLFRAHKEDLAAFAHCIAKEITCCFQLVQGFAQVDNMDAVARVENERLHLRVPTLGLMAEVYSGIQQFLYANTNHYVSFG